MKHKFLIFAFVIAVLVASIISAGNSENTEPLLITKIHGQVFLNGNPLNEGIIKVYVNNVFDSDAQIDEGVYFSSVSIYNQSEVVLKIYANNTFLKEERLSVLVGSEEEYNIYIFTSATVSNTSNNSNNSQNSGTSNNGTSQGTNTTPDAGTTPAPNTTTNTVQNTGTNTTTGDNTTTGNNNTSGNNSNIGDNTTTSNQSSQPPTLPHTPTQQNTSNQNSSNQSDNQTGTNQVNTSQINTYSLQDNETNGTMTNPPHTDFITPLSIIAIFILLSVLIFLIVRRKQYL